MATRVNGTKHAATRAPASARLDPIEHRLRARIDTLTTERNQAREALTHQHPGTATGHCELCGWAAQGRLCHDHKDLA